MVHSVAIKYKTPPTNQAAEQGLIPLQQDLLHSLLYESLTMNLLVQSKS